MKRLNFITLLYINFCIMILIVFRLGWGNVSLCGKLIYLVGIFGKKHAVWDFLSV